MSRGAPSTVLTFAMKFEFVVELSSIYIYTYTQAQDMWNHQNQKKPLSACYSDHPLIPLTDYLTLLS